MGKRKQVTLTKDSTMQDIFASQLDPASFSGLLTFIVLNDNGPETVVSWKKKDIDKITDQYEFVEKEDKKLPRFIKK